ncbi:MAG: hypothetical protein ACRD1R_05420 [Acidobacteriota bacterium]
MEWSHKGLTFEIITEELGPFVMASARTPKEGPYTRVRPFTALVIGRENAIESLKEQIRLEYRKVPVAV